MTYTDVPESVDRQVRARTPGPGEELIARLAERLGGRVSAAAVYGDPVTASGVTVIPVARVAMGIGAGSGEERKRETDEKRDGGGGGGAVSAVPIGFIEITDGSAVFKPIRRTTAFSLVVPLALVTGWTAVRIVRTVLRHTSKASESASSPRRPKNARG